MKTKYRIIKPKKLSYSITIPFKGKRFVLHDGGKSVKSVTFKGVTLDT